MVSVRATTPITLSSLPPVAAAPAAAPTAPLVVVVSPPPPPPPPYLPPLPAATLLSEATLNRNVTTKPAPTNQPKPSLMPKLDLDLFGYAGAGAVLGGVFHAAKVFSEESDFNHTLYKYEATPNQTYYYRTDNRFFNSTDRQLSKALPDVVYKDPFDPQRPIAELQYKYDRLNQKDWYAPFVNVLKRKAPSFYDDDLHPKRVILFDDNGQAAKQVIEYMDDGSVEVTNKVGSRIKEVYKKLGDTDTYALTHRYKLGAEGSYKLLETHLLEETAEGGLKARIISGANNLEAWVKHKLPQLETVLESPVIKDRFVDFDLTLPSKAKRVSGPISRPLLNSMINPQGIARYGTIGACVAMVAGLLTAMATSTKVNLAFNQS